MLAFHRQNFTYYLQILSTQKPLQPQMQWIFLSYILLMFKWQRAGRFQTICIPTTIVLSWPRGDPTCPWTKHESPSQSKTKALSIILKEVSKHINYTRLYLPYSKHTTSRPTFSWLKVFFTLKQLAVWSSGYDAGLPVLRTRVRIQYSPKTFFWFLLILTFK